MSDRFFKAALELFQIDGSSVEEAFADSHPGMMLDSEEYLRYTKRFDYVYFFEKPLAVYHWKLGELVETSVDQIFRDTKVKLIILDDDGSFWFLPLRTLRKYFLKVPGLVRYGEEVTIDTSIIKEISGVSYYSNQFSAFQGLKGFSNQ